MARITLRTYAQLIPISNRHVQTAETYVVGNLEYNGEHLGVALGFIFTQPLFGDILLQVIQRRFYFFSLFFWGRIRMK